MHSLTRLLLLLLLSGRTECRTGLGREKRPPGGPGVARACSLLPVCTIGWQRPEGAAGEGQPAYVSRSPEERLPGAAQVGEEPKETGQSLWPLTLSLERRLQEDMTVCFLGLPLGLLPLFRF